MVLRKHCLHRSCCLSPWRPFPDDSPDAASRRAGAGWPYPVAWQHAGLSTAGREIRPGEPISCRSKSPVENDLPQGRIKSASHRAACAVPQSSAIGTLTGALPLCIIASCAERWLTSLARPSCRWRHGGGDGVTAFRAAGGIGRWP